MWTTGTEVCHGGRTGVCARCHLAVGSEVFENFAHPFSAIILTLHHHHHHHPSRASPPLEPPTPSRPVHFQSFCSWSCDICRIISSVCRSSLTGFSDTEPLTNTVRHKTVTWLGRGGGGPEEDIRCWAHSLAQHPDSTPFHWHSGARCLSKPTLLSG